jgi:hypothetical protein
MNRRGFLSWMTATGAVLVLPTSVRPSKLWEIAPPPPVYAPDQLASLLAKGLLALRENALMPKLVDGSALKVTEGALSLSRVPGGDYWQLATLDFKYPA